MKTPIPLLTIFFAAALCQAQVPKAFTGLFEKNIPVRGQIGVVLPPQEIDKYVAKLEVAARQNPEWFRQFSEQAKPGAPLPYDENLGITREEYDEYLALWAKREFKPVEDVMLILRENKEGAWSLVSTGGAASLATLRYHAKEDCFRSPNGELERIEDIDADPASILGKWTGHEWKFEEETDLGVTKENVALGRLAGDKFGLVVYRVLELSSEGTRLLDKSLVIRFPLGKAGQIQEPVPPGR